MYERNCNYDSICRLCPNFVFYEVMCLRLFVEYKKCFVFICKCVDASGKTCVCGSKID